MSNPKMNAQFDELLHLFKQRINDLIMYTLNEYVDGPEDKGSNFNVLRAAHMMCAFHLGTLEGILEPLMDEGKIPREKLIEQRDKAIAEGLKHADHHARGACTDCEN